ncbi:MAG: RES family NAD+ phosphorylase [Rhodospirillales bacterium]|nr:RES family NAD+ phosphorylase [Rhodospirillales bacterium]
MAGGRKRRDNKLIDAIEAIEPLAFTGPVWRVVREGRDPTRCSRSGGRWDDGTFDVLYTSADRVGAISEMKFHIMRGQPVIPSRVDYQVCELDVTMDRTLKFLDLAALSKVGLDISRYGQLSYQDKTAAYPRSQDIGEVAHFLDYDGLVVPSARCPCSNVVVFCDAVPPDAMKKIADHGRVNWDEAEI